LLNSDYHTAFNSIQKIKIQKGYALVDIIEELLNHINSLDMPARTRVYILDKLSEIEYNMQAGCSEKLQLGALVGIFRIGMELAAKA
jgi:replication factor C subunit 3/5